jgi:hypothetical protein
VKKPTASVRASHLNTGTGIPDEELAWPETLGRVTRLPGLHLEVASRSTVTPYGGLALASAFLKRFRVAQEIDARVQVLKIHLPFFESDHVLAQALNLYVGGECLEDQAALQHDEGVLRMLGACRLPDPTTAGDFLRRFEERRNPGSLAGLRAATDAVQDAVWGKLAGKRRRKRDVAVLDLDGHTKTLCGVQKEGADFDHKGRWSYNVLLASLAGSGECVAVRLRPGNVRSSEGAAELLEQTLPRVKGRFAQVLVPARPRAPASPSWRGRPRIGSPGPRRCRRRRGSRSVRGRIGTSKSGAPAPASSRGARNATGGAGARGSGATRISSSPASGWPRSPGPRRAPRRPTG